MTSVSTDLQTRYARLVEYLEADPSNLALNADIIELCGLIGREQEALTRLAALEQEQGSDPELLNRLGVAFLNSGQHRAALDQFLKLNLETRAAAPVNFNVAWSLSMLQKHDEALDVLLPETIESMPDAAMLELQLLHQLGRFGEAYDKAKIYTSHFPHHIGLQAAVSVIAIDNKDMVLAKSAGQAAGGHPDARTSLGTIALLEGDLRQARTCFSDVLSDRSDIPRAHIGMGLVELTDKAYGKAAASLDMGAGRFETHVGSWVAAGWAYCLDGDLETARQRFETALQLDRNFAESHGSLAVILILLGETEVATNHITLANRLDRSCFSAILAQTLQLSAQGDEQAASALFQRTLKAPIDASGATIEDVVARLGLQ